MRVITRPEIAACAALIVALLGCSGEPERAPRPQRTEAPSEPIALRLGGREVLVRCALACEAARTELTRLRDGCVADPTSTPHHVVAQGPLVALGCCTEAESAYRRACGVEGIEPCASRWSAECESGRLAP